MIVRVGLMLALLGCLAMARPRYGWTLFRSRKQRFAVYYPPGWHLPFGTDLPMMEATNFPRSEGGHGVGIPQQGAELQVGPVADSGASINDLVVRSLRFVHDPPSIDQTILTGLAGPNTCRTLRQVEYHENLGSELDPILLHWTFYYCEVHGRIFAVSMAYYRGNKDAAMLEGLARDVAMTLRIYK